MYERLGLGTSYRANTQIEPRYAPVEFNYDYGYAPKWGIIIHVMLVHINEIIKLKLFMIGLTT